MDRKSPLRVTLLTLGCRSNQSDAASLEAELIAAGHAIVPFQEPADVYILHTCTVTQKTDYQSRQLIRRATAKNPEAQIIVTGCYAQVSPQILKAHPGVHYVVGVGEREKIPALVKDGEKPGRARVLEAAGDDPWPFEGRGVSLPAGRTRVNLKIQDGCNAFCAYCIVPYARGRNRSLPLQRARLKARELASLGCREIVLTGIHLGTYGADLTPACSLLDLLEILESETPISRIRLSSIEPGEFSPELIEFLGRSKKVCPHLHIPLQSGDDGTLKRMGRNYAGAFFKDLVLRLTETIPDLAVGVDVIGGFPGEDEAAFENTKSLIAGLPLAYLHVFPFSRRPGTPADTFPGQVPSRIIQERCRLLRVLGERKRQHFHEAFIGRPARVLIESKRDRETGMLKGYSRNYLPVRVRDGEAWINQEVSVTIIEANEKHVTGKMIQP